MKSSEKWEPLLTAVERRPRPKVFEILRTRVAFLRKQESMHVVAYFKVPSLDSRLHENDEIPHAKRCQKKLLGPNRVRVSP